MKFQSNKVIRKVGGALLILAVIVVTIALVVYFTQTKSKIKGAIVTNGYGCSDIGMSIFKKGGNAAEAAIATLFCEGVSMPQSMGLGGGFLLTIYTKATGEVWSLDAREVAPGAATVDMFHGNSSLSQRGGTSVAVPGELIGYWYLYEKFGGNLPWKDLVQPTIDLCKNGVYVTSYLDSIFKGRKELLYADPVLRDIYIDPRTNETYTEGQYVKRTRLAKTLEVIAEEGGLALHNGTLTESFVRDVQDHDGIITVEDMNGYRPEWQQPVQTSLLNDQTLYTAPLPGSGLILTFILNILSDFIDVGESTMSVTTHQRIVESFKFGYAKRTLLGDQRFLEIDDLVSELTSKEHAEKTRNSIFDYQTFQDAAYYGADTSNVEDHGTAHVSILAPNGDAVSVTSTINFYFGAGFASDSTGIILNDEMDDFASPNITSGFNIPPSPANYIAPGKRPLSSMCPSIVVDSNGDVQLVTGAAGGTKITTSNALIIVKHLWYGMDLKTTVDDKRFHHQLFPMSITFEGFYKTEGFDVVEGLAAIGHRYNITDDDGFAAATAISRKNGNANQVTGVYDRRRTGSISYLY